jgi:hypothetical protein
VSQISRLAIDIDEVIEQVVTGAHLRSVFSAPRLNRSKRSSCGIRRSQVSINAAQYDGLPACARSLICHKTASGRRSVELDQVVAELDLDGRYAGPPHHWAKSPVPGTRRKLLDG